MDTIETIPVYLTELEAREFLLFQKHRKLFEELEKQRIFEIEYGKLTFNIAFGEIQNIVKEQMVFKKK